MKRMLIALGLCAAIGVQAAILNSSFETGTDDNWTMYKRWVGDYPDGDGRAPGSPTAPTISVVSSDGSLMPFYGSSPYYNPDSGGDYFVKITTGAANQHQGVLQSFTLTSPTAIYGWFTAGSLGSPIITVNLTDENDESYDLISFDGTPMSWQLWNFGTVPAGNYTLYFDVYGTTAGWTGYFDMSVVPEPRGWLMGGALLGMLGVGEFLRRRRAAKANA